MSLIIQNKYKEYSRVREAEETVDDLKENVVPKRYGICGQGANYLFAWTYWACLWAKIFTDFMFPAAPSTLTILQPDVECNGLWPSVPSKDAIRELTVAFISSSATLC